MNPTTQNIGLVLAPPVDAHGLRTLAKSAHASLRHCRFFSKYTGWPKMRQHCLTAHVFKTGKSLKQKQTENVYK